MEQKIEWRMLPMVATPEMASAAFAGKIEQQCCQTQQRNRQRMAENYAKMVAAAPVRQADQAALDAIQRDTLEAADLQSYLVGNARTVRPVDGSGLMAWALAALKSRDTAANANANDAEEEACALRDYVRDLINWSDVSQSMGVLHKIIDEGRALVISSTPRTLQNQLAAVTAERDALQKQLDALQGTGRYTSISKGGEYALMGTIKGAGSLKGLICRAYRDTQTGAMYFREPEEFITRIKPIVVEQAQ